MKRLNIEKRKLFQNAMIATLAVVLVITLFYFVYLFLGLFANYFGDIVNFLLPFIFAFLVAYILKPLVDVMENQKIPRIIAVLLIYAVIGGAVVFIGTRAFTALILEIQNLIYMAPELAQDIENLIEELEVWFEDLNLPITVTETIRENIIEIERDITNYLDQIVDFESIFAIAMEIFGHILSLIAFPIILFYFLKDTDYLKAQLTKAIPSQYRCKVTSLAQDVNKVIGAYIRSQLIICGFIGVLTYLGLLILGVDFALLLGVFAGITNIIPYFGPWIGAIPSILVAFLQEPILAIQVIILITIIQQIESQVVAPQIYGRNLAIHPLAVIAVLIFGGRFFGILGMILAVPVLAVVRAIIQNTAIHLWFTGDKSILSENNNNQEINDS